MRSHMDPLASLGLESTPIELSLSLIYENVEWLGE